MKLVLLCSTFAVMVLAQFADATSGGKIHNHGIVPRDTNGLWGIICAPFLHLSMSHLLVNAVPFLALGLVVLMRSYGIKTFLFLSAFAAVASGLFVWAMGDDFVHVGSSVLVFAYFSFIVAHGVITREWRASMFAFALIIVYGTTFLSMFSQAVERGSAISVGGESLSWMYMLGGAVAGIIYSFFDHSVRRGAGMDIYGYNRSLEQGSTEERAGLKASENDFV